MYKYYKEFHFYVWSGEQFSVNSWNLSHLGFPNPEGSNSFLNSQLLFHGRIYIKELSYSDLGCVCFHVFWLLVQDSRWPNPHQAFSFTAKLPPVSQVPVFRWRAICSLRSEVSGKPELIITLRLQNGTAS